MFVDIACFHSVNTTAFCNSIFTPFQIPKKEDVYGKYKKIRNSKFASTKLKLHMLVYYHLTMGWLRIFSRLHGCFMKLSATECFLGVEYVKISLIQI